MALEMGSEGHLVPGGNVTTATVQQHLPASVWRLVQLYRVDKRQKCSSPCCSSFMLCTCVRDNTWDYDLKYLLNITCIMTIAANRLIGEVV